MSKFEKTHPVNIVLRGSERFQQAHGARKLGSKVVEAVTGSPSFLYEQLAWHSGKDVSAQFPGGTATVPGDPYAARVMRNRVTCTVLATKRDFRENLVAFYEPKFSTPVIEAVAYVHRGVAHIGTPTEGNELFGDLSDELSGDGHSYEYDAFAMRLGRKPLEAALGLWLPEKNAFVGLETVVQTSLVHVSQLERDNPSVPLG